LLLLWGFVIQSLSIYGFLIYANKNSIVYLLFIIYYLLLILDISKGQKYAISQSKHYKKIIKISRKKVNNNYFVDEEIFMDNARKHTSSLYKNGVTSFYTGKIVMFIFFPFIILGKITIALGILSARYFPNSDFILYGAMLFVGTIFFLMGLTGFLTYLKLDLSEDKEKK
jgi:hypothetical protein